MIDKTKLGLHLPTDPRWVNLAEMSLEYILTDHAFCEQKAATACISLIQQYPDKKELVKALMPVVTEEWGHFRMVLREMEKRDMSLGFQRKDEYVNALHKFRKHGNRDVNLIESLLICALIEARSCERFRLLSLHISDESLKQFYYDLMVSEAGHYKMFLELAIHYGGEGMVR
ncbi:MAG TPA: tRNA-(ms[2]io[6]A)-hydroxylase, partial [Saprospiraceae bacterium]|nr:tRNA-(ms[2]io[6]A)-hydroxylase [Saprospiraceae bacterium]